MAKDLFRSWCKVTGWTGLSRLLGFLRDVVFAFAFGSGAVFDAFVLAFQIPNAMRRLFAEGAFSQALVPVYVEYQRGDEGRRQAFLSSLLGILVIVLLLVTLLGVFGSAGIIRLFAPGSEQATLAATLLRWTFPYLACISFVAMLAAILNAHQRYSVAAAVAVILNAVLIMASLIAHQWSGSILWVARAVPLAGLIQLLVMALALRRTMALPKPHFGALHPGVRQVLRLVLAGLYGASVFQLGILLDNFLASFLAEGSLSALYFSQRLVQLPIGLCAASVVTVCMPHLARSLQKKDHKALRKCLHWASQTLFLLGMPASVALFLLAPAILTTLFQYGAYSEHAVVQATLSLRALALGLPAFMFMKVLASVFYAKQDMKTPVKWASYALLLNALASIVCMQWWAHAGIALGSSIAAWFNVLGLGWQLHRHLPEGFSWPIAALRAVMIATLVMAVVLCWLPHPGVWLAMATMVRVLSLSSCIIGGLFIFLLVLYLQGGHVSLRDFWQRWTVLSLSS